MNRYKITSALCAATMLSGCQSFSLTSWMFKGSKAGVEQPTRLAIDASATLEEGRLHLRGGKIAAAIASFEVAALDPLNRAEAANGLAVAYAKLERFDLAERYFRAAISTDPADTKYVANLLRLQKQVLTVERQENVRMAAALPQNTETNINSKEPSTSMIGGPLIRISLAEVHVRSVALPSAAPAIEIAYRKPLTIPETAGSEKSTAEPPQKTSRPVEPLTVAFGE